MDYSVNAATAANQYRAARAAERGAPPVCTHCPVHCPARQQQQQGGKRKNKTLKSRKSGRQTRSRR